MLERRLNHHLRSTRRQPPRKPGADKCKKGHGSRTRREAASATGASGGKEQTISSGVHQGVALIAVEDRLYGHHLPGGGDPQAAMTGGPYRRDATRIPISQLMVAGLAIGMMVDARLGRPRPLSRTRRTVQGRTRREAPLATVVDLTTRSQGRLGATRPIAVLVHHTDATEAMRSVVVEIGGSETEVVVIVANALPLVIHRTHRHPDARGDDTLHLRHCLRQRPRQHLQASPRCVVLTRITNVASGLFPGLPRLLLLLLLLLLAGVR